MSRTLKYKWYIGLVDWIEMAENFTKYEGHVWEDLQPINEIVVHKLGFIDWGSKFQIFEVLGCHQDETPFYEP